MKNRFKLVAVLSVLLTVSSCYDDEFNNINSELNYLNNKVIDLQADLEALSNVNTQIATLQTALASLTETYNSDQAEVEDLMDLVNQLSILANAQGADLEAITNEIAVIQSYIGTDLDEAISSLEDFIEDYFVPENFLFEEIASIGIGGDDVAEIGAFDPVTKKLFLTNPESNVVSVVNMANPANPALGTPIDITPFGGGLNSVAVADGKLAIAVEGKDKVADLGSIVVFNTLDLNTPYGVFEAGYLPDMVTFTHDGHYVLSANEGEPNDDYTLDHKGSITIVDIEAKSAKTIDFEAFNSQEAALEANHFRVFGPNATLAQDVEPEYIAITSDSETAVVALQENNGIAILDIASQSISSIVPLGVKDYSLPENMMDFSDKDETVGNLKNYNVKSYYMPDAIDIMEINGVDYIFTANEGDARDYDGYSEEERVEDLKLDTIAYPDAATLQLKQNLGRLKTTSAFGDTDGDGDVDQIFGYGARSFTIWGMDGSIVYDSNNFLTTKTLELGTYPENRSDDKGTEPESIITFKSNGNAYIAVGLERSGDVMIFDVSNPSSPSFIQSLENTSPEGLIVVKAQDSPTGKTLLIVANEFPDGAPVSIYSK